MKKVLELIFTDNSNTLTIASTILGLIYFLREWLKEYLHSRKERKSIKLKLETHPEKSIILIEKHTPLPGQITDYGIELGTGEFISLAPWKNTQID